MELVSNGKLLGISAGEKLLEIRVGGNCLKLVSSAKLLEISAGGKPLGRGRRHRGNYLELVSSGKLLGINAGRKTAWSWCRGKTT